MKKSYPWRLIMGAGLILVGIMALGQSMGWFNVTGWAWSILFFVGGLAFLTITLSNREMWWGLIPGLTLFGVGAEILNGALNTSLSDKLGGIFVLGGIGLAFWLIYFLQKSNWWAIIPGGVMATLVMVVLFENARGGLETGGIFMLGLAATFALVALLTASTDHSMRWAWIPAGILAVIGALIFFSALDMMGIIWGVALIGVGILMAWRSFKK